ncbi:Gfo/Idh/MocA family oxidoreductase [Nocardioides sp. LHD-245]|uniref:Gfo/Idh/MocA family protein n=1 Tax=Nocardioides sp. LHD-245 TaxID=3051387 RepID=UPI0027E15922|nr:Gfo/Idh/MocA family oxidoreductase [Nocardioides sp. LHD-245]
MEDVLPLRVGVVGLGLMGDVMVRAVQQRPDLELAYVSEADPGLGAEVAAAAGVPFVPAADAATSATLEATSADVVAIATPPPTHAPLAISALRAGRSVLCEKPMAMSAPEARAMAAAAQEAGRTAVVDHQLRFNPARIRLRELVADGYVGTPVHVSSVAYFPKLVDQPWTWWHRRDQGGGLLNEYGSHTVDLLRWILGEVAWATGALATVAGDRRARADGRVETVDSDDLAQLHLQFASGVTADVLMSAAPSYPERRLEIHGTGGSLVLGADDVITGTRRGQVPEEFRDLEPDPSLIGWADDTFTQPFVRLLDEFVRCVRTGETPSVASTFEDGWRTIEVLDQVRRSARGEGVA